MTRATERWQETMRYAVDTGAVPPGPRRSRWPLALAAVVGTAALGLAGAASSGRDPGKRAWIDPDRPAITLANAGPVAEAARKRSYTRNAGAEANAAAAEPVATRSDLAAAREPLARPEPTITGATAPASDDEARMVNHTLSPVLRAADRPARRPTLRKARLTPEPIASGPRPVRKAADDAREGVGKREAERTAPSARAPRPASRAVAVNTRPEWASAVAPARVVSVCLYYVVCF
jgi:hypothetical protein